MNPSAVDKPTPTHQRANSGTHRRISHHRQQPRRAFVTWVMAALGGQWHASWSRAHGFSGLKVLGQPMPSTVEARLPINCDWYPIQVKQKDKAGRPDIDQFAQAMRRAKCAKGFFVSFAFSDDALREIQRFFVEEHAIIVPLTVQEILEEQIGMKLV